MVADKASSRCVAAGALQHDMNPAHDIDSVTRASAAAALAVVRRMPPPRRPSSAAVALMLMTLLTAGCFGGARRRPVATPPPDSAASAKDAAKARDENRAGLAALADDKPADAAGRFRNAITADPTFGPAHNNLGKIHFNDRDLYRAASEFQIAAKLMPGQAEPPNNLGLVLESAGKLDDAATQYERAVALAGDDPQYVGNLARVRVRRGQTAADPTTRRLLERLILIDDRPVWVDWARRQLSRAGVSQPGETSPPRGVPLADPGHYP